MTTTISLDGRIFSSIANSAGGDVGSETLFHYHQDGPLVWAEYYGGSVRKGHLIATADIDGKLDMRYHHFDIKGAIKTGVCRSTPELLPDGRVRLHERWQWTAGDSGEGESVIEEVTAPKIN